MVKNPPANAGLAGDVGSIPGSGRSPGEENGNSFQHSCLGNPMKRGALWAIIHEVTRVGHNSATKKKKKDPDKSYLIVTLVIRITSDLVKTAV